MVQLTFDNNERVFYVADTHFGHSNIIKLCNRPFADVEEMDATLIENWNRVVTDDDYVIVIGDFTFKGNRSCDYAKKLKGKKYLVLGNHDKINSGGFIDSFDMLLVKHNGRLIHCCHYPLIEWYNYFRGSYHFYGHIHNNSNEANKIMDSVTGAYNVGVDTIGFTPRLANEIIWGI